MAAAGALSPELGERERAYVYSVAMKILKDEDAAEDATQEALLLAHRHRESFRGESRFSTWLYRVAATSALMQLRRTRRRGREVLYASSPGLDEAALPFDPRDPAPGPETRAADRELVGRLEGVLAGLGDHARALVHLRFVAGYTEPEIAALTGLPLSTIKTRAYRTRTRLRRALSDSLAPADGGEVVESPRCTGSASPSSSSRSSPPRASARRARSPSSHRAIPAAPRAGPAAPAP